MKAITSKVKLLEKLKKYNLHTNGFQFYLSDFHKSSVGKAVANKVINEGIVERACPPSWFEAAYRLKKQ